MSLTEPRNPFYPILLLFCLLFVLTTLAVALLPWLEGKAQEAGQDVPPSAFRQMLRSDGWRFRVIEVTGVIAFGLLSMGLDRLRRLQKERAAGTIPPANKGPPAG